MDSPVKDIVGVVEGLVRAKDANSQRNVLQRYFTEDASFDHPLCAVSSYSNSRDTGVLPIYQWLRIMFDDTLIQVHDVAFDQSTNHLFLHATQTLRAPFIRRFYAPQATLIVLLSLRRRNDGKYYISRQQDVYPIQEMPGRLLPGLSDAVDIVKLFAGFFCALLAAVFQLLGFWRVTEPHAKLQ